jgi:hypothetical protein
VSISIRNHRAVAANRSITIHDLQMHIACIGAYGLGTAVSGLRAVMENKLEFVNSDHTLETFVDVMAKALLDFQSEMR